MTRTPIVLLDLAEVPGVAVNELIAPALAPPLPRAPGHLAARIACSTRPRGPNTGRPHPYQQNPFPYAVERSASTPHVPWCLNDDKHYAEADELTTALSEQIYPAPKSK